jgi:hypothetical protein
MLELRSKKLKVEGKAYREVEITVCYERLSNDRNGNPRYTLSFFWNEFNLNNMLHDNYKHKINKNGYLVLTSYNIDTTIESILKDIKNYLKNNF